MIIKTIIDEDFSNYKSPSMLIAFPHCNFKCDVESKQQVCQNGTLAILPNIELSEKEIINRYLNNNLTNAIVIGGLEPMDDYIQLYKLISAFRSITDDDIVIYTGYYKNEINKNIIELAVFKNIIIKYGRYIPEKNHYFEEILGVELASDNQYAERIS